MRNIELNPVRANMVRSPHYLYQALGDDHTSRSAAYKALFKTHLDGDALSDIRSAW